MTFIKRAALLGTVAALASGCASMTNMKDSVASSETLRNPLTCAAAGALIGNEVGRDNDRGYDRGYGRRR